MSRAVRNPSLIILILGALSTVSPLAIDMYLPAFPQIADALHSTPAKVSLSISSYFVGLAAGQLIYGPLLDRFGRKKPLYFGLVLFMVASLLCVQAHSVKTLVAFRALQALGGCAAQVAAMAMVRDFFPVKESARIFSLLVLILGVSPLFAPTIGSFLAVHVGWQSVFNLLASIVLVLLAVVFFYLPEGHPADTSIELHPVHILRTFGSILIVPQFCTFTLAGSFSFAGLLVYVAGSPIIFMDVFHVSPTVYGAIFAGLAVGFIGSNQINILLLRRFSGLQIFRGALYFQCAVAVLFLVGTAYHWYGLPITLVLLFLVLSSLGLISPNATALALAPFDKNIGSASALFGFLQIGIAALASAFVGIFNSKGLIPVLAILAGTSWAALVIYKIGGRNVVQEPKAAEGEAAVVHI
jgi:DHA1 family bicyclomycin/chloramphenicol resistance-like MFS transporter